VVGDAANLNRVFIDADDSVHNPDRDSGLLQHATLLDVQLQITADQSRRQTCSIELRGVSANAR